ncbi:MAG: M23 family metallopeptidase [Lachnospiraceae bacterium]|nr:M23 family metallopeptidase [Lachnospiraceae bacterium]
MGKKNPKKEKSGWSGWLIGLVFLAFFVNGATVQILTPGSEENLNAYTTESEDFRAMDFGKGGLEAMQAFAAENDLDFFEVVTTTMIRHDYHFPGYFPPEFTKETFMEERERLMEKKPEAYAKCLSVYRSLLESLVCFPVPENEGADPAFVSYENSWRYERSFGGERTHEGTDLMAGEKERGYFPVVSVNGGVVEQVGWLKLGGWRIGIRSDSGVYYYYAHLYSYARDWQVGDTVSAGEWLGFMGDSGYSEVEGTVGNFPVHLHLGIYLATDHFAELSVNPYYLLKYLEPKATKASY